MTYILLITYLFAGLFAIQKLSFFKTTDLKIRFLQAVFLLKFICSVFLWAIYTYYYTDRSTADLYKYFDDSLYLFDAIKTKPADFFKMLFGLDSNEAYFREHYYDHMQHWYREWQRPYFNDNRTMIRFNALVRIFSFGNIHIHNLVSAFLSFTGLTAFYKVFKQFIEKKVWLAIGIFLLPSILFWASGILKESLLIFGLGWFIYSWDKLMQKQYRFGLVFLFSTLLLMYLKTYIILIFAPLLLAYLLAKTKIFSKVWISYALVLGAIFIGSLGVRTLDRNYDIYRNIYKKQEDFIRLAKDLNSGSLLDVKPLQPTFKSFVSSFPEALTNSFFMRWPWQSKSIFEWMANLENGVLIALFIFACVKRRNIKNQLNRILFCGLFVFFLYLLIGYTTPVLGAIVRYRVPALPFWLVFCLILIPENVFLYKEKKWQYWILEK